MEVTYYWQPSTDLIHVSTVEMANASSRVLLHTWVSISNHQQELATNGLSLKHCRAWPVWVTESLPWITYWIILHGSSFVLPFGYSQHLTNELWNSTVLLLWGKAVQIHTLNMAGGAGLPQMSHQVPLSPILSAQSLLITYPKCLVQALLSDPLPVTLSVFLLFSTLFYPKMITVEAPPTLPCLSLITRLSVILNLFNIHTLLMCPCLLWQHFTWFPMKMLIFISAHNYTMDFIKSIFFTPFLPMMAH